MSVGHTGNTQPSIDLEEHISKGNVNAKKVAVYSYDSVNDVLNPVNNTNPLPLIDATYAVRLDTVADPILYLGKASIGSLTSNPVWQLAKLDTSTGLIKTWSGGSATFTNIWDNRTSLTYS